ncbi:DUF4968 domain-containing protein [Olivibacter sp. SDN3]|uniref:glycoside hydrolase family 31 protein n=1 Tax=Olivibacter sp. SDN3 TaxID=2764720 RepID=UPI0016513E17|nr:TIM-barrel domain-containing protein [Olivibacter sp. SDN3]QNL50482.1 DUF4968 domain-containing protein [Olivibacter sp. SDN3]
MINSIKHNLSLIALLLIVTAKAQPLGNYKGGFKRENNTFHFTTEQGAVALSFCEEAMFRVRAAWGGSFEAPEHLMVSRYDWGDVSVSATEEASHFLLKTALLEIRVQKHPFGIAVYDKAGELLSQDVEALRKEGTAVYTTKSLAVDEHFFGFGERMDFLDQRNKRLTLNVGRGKGRPHEVGAYNVLEANYSPIPFFMSTRGYGIFLHNSFETKWDMGSSVSDAYTFGAGAGELDYYFIYGPSFPRILDHYTDLTGKSPLLAKFALGLHVGTYSGGTWGHEELTSDQYVIELARKFRELGIPIDLLWLDSTWRIFGKEGGKGATSFEWRETFKDPKGMFDSLYAMNYQMVGLHLRPRFDNGEKLNLLDQARAKGLVYPEPDNKGEFVNFFDQQSVDWWWDNGVKRVADLGAMFLKTDEGSAFGGLANESDKTGPTDETAQRLHNVFPIAYAKAPYEKFQEFNGLRGLNHTREGYAGIQRYPFIFAGDWPSEWQYFEPVIKAGLNIGLSGVGFWGHCMGGFEHVADPELYIRWVQFGMFSPIAMLFGMEHPQYKEPWQYGEDALRNFKKYDALRYALIPYIYSSSYQQYQTGIPLMRALPVHYQDDPNVYNITDQYLFGDALMVCPVTTKGAKTRTVYLPDGTWYNYWTGEEYEGRQYVHVTTPLDTLPLFAKAGAIIPMQQVTQYTGGQNIKQLTLDIFPGNDGRFSLYDDDGKSLDYQEGVFAITDIAAELTAEKFIVHVEQPKGGFKGEPHNFLFKIRWNGRTKPKEVAENEHAVEEMKSLTDLKGTSGWFYDEKEEHIYIGTLSENAQDINVNIGLN